MRETRIVPGGFYADRRESVGSRARLPVFCAVDDAGNVYSVRVDLVGNMRWTIRKVHMHKGYALVTGFPVHRMVCAAFHGLPAPGMMVRHLNGIASDNRASNLCWGTRVENARDTVAHGRCALVALNADPGHVARGGDVLRAWHADPVNRAALAARLRTPQQRESIREAHADKARCKLIAAHAHRLALARARRAIVAPVSDWTADKTGSPQALGAPS